MSIRQQKYSAPRGGPGPQVEQWAPVEAARQTRERVVQEGGSDRPVVLEAQARAARDEHQLVGRRRGVGGQEHRVVVDGDEAARARRTSSETRSSSSCWPSVRVA